jgi:hypothetical protein
MKTVDPYYEWLGIPSKDQPPNHYRLLGLELFEENRSVIDTAANRQMSFIKQYQTGADSELSQKLLNELSAARLCLLSPSAKAAYDERLRAQLGTQDASAPAMPVQSVFRWRNEPTAVPEESASPGPLASAIPLPVATVLDSDPASATSPAAPVVTGRQSGVLPRSTARLGTLAVATGLVATALVIVLAFVLASPRGSESTSPVDTVAQRPGEPPANTEAEVETEVEAEAEAETETEVEAEVEKLRSNPFVAENVTASEPPTFSRPSEPDAEPSRATGAVDSELPAAPMTVSATPPIVSSAELPKTTAPPPPVETLEQGERRLQAAAQPKTPVPNAEAQQTATKAAGELFAERFKQAETTAEKTALATDMMSAAGKVPAGSADQYVLLKIARDMAAGTGDAATALQAAERLLEQFDEPAAEVTGETLLTAAREATTSAQHKAVAEAAHSMAEQLADADQYEMALRLCEAARSSAQTAKLYLLSRELTTQIEELKRQQLLSEEYRKALSVLEDKPRDPEANLIAGRHLCFVKGNWERGVPMLALGSDAALKAAAIKDLRGASSVEEQVAIGDAWWDLAETREGEEGDTLRLRAGFWYRQAEPQLAEGLVALKVKQRLAELEKVGHEVPTAPIATTERRVAGPRQQLLAGAVLIMTFEAETFAPREGRMFVADLSGCGNHGIVEGAKLIPAGRAGAALQFEGNASIVLPTLATQLTQRLRQLSISSWVMPADLKGDSMVLDVGFVANASITLFRSDDKFRFSLCETVCAFEGVQPRNWYHVVAVWDGIEQRIYVDGVLADKITNDRLVLDATSIAVGHGARLGTQAKSASRAGRYFQGLIDEVAIFNRALSEDEIQILLQLGRGGEPLVKAPRTRSGR